MNKGEYVYKILRNRVFSGFYWPRERLVESDLSEELGVNRNIIRDILKRLNVEGLVVSENNKGNFVAEISAEDVFETYQIEAFLESAAAFLATDHIKDKELKKLEYLINKSRELSSQDSEKWELCNREIHKLVNTACGNKKLIKIIADNVKVTKYWFIVLSTPEEVSKRNEEHEIILKALRKRDPIEVRQAMENHIMEAGKDIWIRLQNTLPPGRHHKQIETHKLLTAQEARNGGQGIIKLHETF